MATTVQSHQQTPHASGQSHATPQAHPTPHPNQAPHANGGGQRPRGVNKGDRTTVSNHDQDDRGGSAAASQNIVHNVQQQGPGGAGNKPGGAGDVPAANGKGGNGKGGSNMNVTVQKWGSGKNDSVWSSLKSAGWSDKQIQSQGLVNKVAQMNHLQNPNIVQTGQHLEIPKGPGGGGAQGGGGGTGVHSSQLGLSGGMNGSAQNMTNAARQAINQTKNNAQPPHNTVGGNVGQWIGQAMQVMQQHGVDTSKINPQDLATIIQHESSGNPNAINRTDSNAAAGHPSQGLMQTIPSTFNAYALPGHNSITNPVDNIIAGSRYILSRYGSTANVPGIKALNSGGSYVGY